MRIQVLSDLHFETEVCEPAPAAGAHLLVLAGDIDSTHAALDRFRGWPVPVLFVAGNHEFDGRDVDAALGMLRERCARNGLIMLERDAVVIAAGGRRLRFLGTTGWSDFDLLGAGQRERCMRAARFFLEQVQQSTRDGQPFGAEQVRIESARCADWLATALAEPRSSPDHDDTVVITHFGPTPRSIDPRYGMQPSSASFCNDWSRLMGAAALWIHGHVHCRHDYHVAGTRVVCNARGLSDKGETEDYDGGRLYEV